MKASTKRALYWLPRILTLAVAGWLAVFALDVFGEGYRLREALMAFVIHLTPTWLILATLAVAWRRERMGALLLGAGGAAYAVSALEHGAWILLISGPLFVAAGLWLVSDLWGERSPEG